MKAYACSRQVHPPQLEVEIGTIGPIAGLEQSDLSRIRQRLVPVKCRMHNEIRVVRAIAVSIFGARRGELPDHALDLPPRFVQSIQKVGRILFHIRPEKIRQVILNSARVTSVAQWILIVSMIVRIEHGEQGYFVPARLTCRAISYAITAFTHKPANA